MPSRLIYDDKHRVGDWVAARVEQAAGWGSFYAMGVEREGEIVAGIVLNNFNDSNAVCHIAVTKPGKDMLMLLRAFADYAFNQCKLNRLTGLVPSDKPDVLAFDLHLGWEEEFLMKQAAPGGADMHVLVMRPENCRWLRGRL